MNRTRRLEITNLVVVIDNAIAEAERIKDDEQDYFDNMPENFQMGEKGEAAEAVVDLLDNVVMSLEEAKTELEGIE